jgi:hypothetical protein
VAALPLPAEGGPFVARPAPTRSAALQAFQQAIRPVAAPAAAAVVAPALARIGPATLARADAGTPAVADPAAATPEPAVAPAPQPAPVPRPAPGPTPAPEPPDLDALADYVLERLRHELRDGRERLGFLLDDMR